MTMGEKIKKIRILRKKTQKELGLAIGFDEKTADVRVAQYESNIRTPKEDLLKKISYALGVDIHALYDHKIDSYIDVMYILFEFEDDYGLSLNEIDGKINFSFSNANITKEEYEYFRRI